MLTATQPAGGQGRRPAGRRRRLHRQAVRHPRADRPGAVDAAAQRRHARGLAADRPAGQPPHQRRDRAVAPPSGDGFAVCHVDLDNFKAFNDRYGWMRGDDVIELLARTLKLAGAEAGPPPPFIGHVGGDDFVVVCTPEQVEPLCLTALERFDAGVLALHEADDVERGLRHGRRPAGPRAALPADLGLDRRRDHRAAPLHRPPRRRGGRQRDEGGRQGAGRARSSPSTGVPTHDGKDAPTDLEPPLPAGGRSSHEPGPSGPLRQSGAQWRQNAPRAPGSVKTRTGGDEAASTRGGPKSATRPRPSAGGPGESPGPTVKVRMRGSARAVLA